MKHMNKILALALALIMVLGLATTAYAADVTISVVDSASGASVAGHTYEVYQIFTGTVAADGKTLSDIVAGASLNEGADVDAILAAIKDKSGAEVETYLKENNLLKANAYEILEAPNWSITAPAGYYLIVDVSTGLPESETASAIILEVVEDTPIKSKHDSQPKTSKKVDDINDSTGEGIAIEWHDGADHDIGDLIDFQLNAILPNKFDSFKANNAAYPFTFHDVEEIGLKFDHIKEVYVVIDGKKVDLVANEDYTVVVSTEEDPLEDDCSFEVHFADLTTIEGIKGGAQLVVEYQSVLTEDAIVGSAGNPNKMRGEFKNTYDDTEPDFTPWDKAIVFTYKVNVDKYKEAIQDGNELEGAVFTLYKEVSAPAEGEETDALTGAKIKEGFADNVKAEALDDEKYYIVISATEAESDGDTFGFKGVDDGNYVLVETTVPDGYNAWDAETFTITADHDEEAEEPKLNTLTGGDLFTGEVDLENGEEVEENFAEEGILDADIINNAGVELPETGGIGTPIFYFLGGLLVLGAVVLLVTKKRMTSAE